LRLIWSNFFYRIYDLCRQCRRDTRLTANIRRFGPNSKNSRTFVQCNLGISSGVNVIIIGYYCCVINCCCKNCILFCWLPVARSHGHRSLIRDRVFSRGNVQLFSVIDTLIAAERGMRKVHILHSIYSV